MSQIPSKSAKMTNKKEYTSNDRVNMCLDTNNRIFKRKSHQVLNTFLQFSSQESENLGDFMSS